MKKQSAGGAKKGIPRILELAAPKKGMLVLSGVLSSLAAAASFVPFIAIYLIIRQVLQVYPDFTNLDTGAVVRYGWLALGGILANVVLYFSGSLLAHAAAFGTLYQLKVDFVRHLTHIPLGWHLNIGSGRMRKIMDEDIEKIETFLAHQFPDLVASITAPVMMLVLLFVIDWRFGLASLCALLLAFLIQFTLMGKDGAALSARLQETQGDMTNATVEYIRGMPVLKAFGQTEKSFTQLYRSIKNYTQFMLEYTFKWENGTCAFNTIINNVYLLLLPVGIFIGMGSGDYAAYALSFLFYLLFAPSVAGVMSKIMYVSSTSMRIGEGVAAFDRIMAIPPLREAADPVSPAGQDIVFEDVGFSYSSKGERALCHVSFTAAAGKVTAIVGPSGGGKSTIAHLIPRFWDVDEGAITLGGVDVRQISFAGLMQRVSFVFQDNYLFQQSVRDNIRMGRPGLADAEVIAAAKAAQCHTFIESLPMGYDTVVGSAGVHFSGGEKQRIAIAQNAPVLVLDEATAFADPENEHLIQKAFSELMRNKTVIMIAHRLSTIQNADHIVVMENGAVRQQGRHPQLLQEENSLYARMWDNYQKAMGWSIAEKKGVV